MPKRKQKLKLESLPPRERQVLDTVYRISEGSVTDVLEALADPPGYSAVRTMLNILVQKGFLRYRHEKNRYLYRPVLPQEEVPQSLLRNLLDTFFVGNPAAAVAAMLNAAAPDLSDEDFREMERLIHNAKKTRKENKQ
jgi:predicted transcriptional regulator